MKGMITEIVLWSILALVLVLIIMNANNFATAVTALGNSSNQLAKTLSGSGYKVAS